MLMCLADLLSPMLCHPPIYKYFTMSRTGCTGFTTYLILPDLDLRPFPGHKYTNLVPMWERNVLTQPNRSKD